MNENPATSAPVTILLGGVIVTAFRAPSVLTDGAVAWQGDRILDLGDASEVKVKYPEARILDGHGGLVLPGLVNLHHHFYSSLARGLNPGRQLDNFGEILDGLWWRLDRALDAETIRISAELALAESIRWGVTTVFDHHASPSVIGGSLEIVAQSVERAGLSAVLCYEITDRNGHEGAIEGLEENLAFFGSRRDDARVRGMLGFHASFTVDDATLRAAADTRLAGMGCHIHIAEDSLDLRVSKVVYDNGPVQRLERWGLIDDRTLAVHCIHLGSNDRRLLADRGAIIIHNPESNANNGVGRLDIDGAAADGCRIGLGTDGMSSSVLGSLRAAFLGVRGGRRDPTAGYTVVPELLAVNADVAGRFLDEPQLGRLEIGAPADFCVLDQAPPTPLTPENVFAQMVYGVAGSPVRHTVARGRVIMEDQRITTLGPTMIAEEAKAATPGLWERFHALGTSRPEWLPTKD